MNPIRLPLPLLVITLCTTSTKCATKDDVTTRQVGCSICPFGETVGFPDRIIPGKERSCEQSSLLNIPAESQECKEFQKSAAWCGCPSAPQECFLCRKEDSSPTPDLRSPIFPDTSCLDYEYVASQLTKDECPSLQERAGSFDVSAYCSCKATKEPKVCELCPGGVLANPKGMSVLPGYTCKEADEGLLQFFTDKSLCINFRRALIARNICECVGSTDYPTAAPTLEETTSEQPTSATSYPTKAPNEKPTQKPTISSTDPSDPVSQPVSKPSSTINSDPTKAPKGGSFKGSFKVSNPPSATPVLGKQPSLSIASKSTKKEYKKGNKGIEKKLKTKKNTSSRR